MSVVALSEQLHVRRPRGRLRVHVRPGVAVSRDARPEELADRSDHGHRRRRLAGVCVSRRDIFLQLQEALLQVGLHVSCLHCSLS